MKLTIITDGRTALDNFPLDVVRGVTALKGMVESLTTVTPAVEINVTIQDSDKSTLLTLTGTRCDPRAVALLVAGYFPKAGAK